MTWFVSAMSYQYSNHNSALKPDLNNSTAGSLGIDFPASYYANSKASSSSSNLRNLTSSMDNFSGTQLTSRANANGGHGAGLASSGGSHVATLDTAQLSDVDRVSLGGKEVGNTAHDEDHDESSCSLPNYDFEKKNLLPVTSEPSDIIDPSEKKPKLNIMSSKTLRNELKKTFLGNFFEACVLGLFDIEIFCGLAFVFQQVTQLIMIWTVVKSNDRMELESPVLPDIVLSRVPLVKKAGQWSEILLFTLFLVFTINVLFHKHRFVNLITSHQL